MKKILVITYSYSPHLTPRALRWSALVEEMHRRGFEVDVVCSWDPGLPKFEQRDGIRIHRVGSTFIGQLRKRVLGRAAFNLDSASGDTTRTDGPKQSRSLFLNWARRAAKVIHDLTWKKIYWPDYAALWYPVALKRAARLITDYAHDAMVTVAPPFTAHLVGLRLKKRFPSIRWIADSGDPFCFAEFSTMNSEFLYARLNRYAERKVFENADNLSVTTEETARIYGDLFPSSRYKTEVIPPLLRPECLQASRTQRKSPNDDKIRLVYVGNFHRRLREPIAYLSTVEAAMPHLGDLAERLELHFLGDAGLVEEHLENAPALRSLCVFHGRSPRSAVMDTMQKASVFVNIGNATSYQLPSKVIEYACFGKPILNFTSTDRDSSVRFLDGYSLALHIQGNDPDGDGAAVADFLRLNGEQRMDEVRLETFVSPYTVEVIAGQYLSMVEPKS